MINLVFILKIFYNFFFFNFYRFLSLYCFVLKPFKLFLDLSSNYFKFNNFFFFLKKKLLYSLKRVKFPLFKYDLLFRFSKISYIMVYKLKKKIILKNKYLKIKFNTNRLSLNNLFFKLTPICGISSYKKNVFKRLNQLTVGSLEYLPLNYTYSGYFMPILVRKKRKQFFVKISGYLFLKKYNFFDEEYSIHASKSKLLNIFPLRAPNINYKILLFFTTKKKINFIKNNIIMKQYNIFKSTKKNFKFFKLNWVKNVKRNFTKHKRIPHTNLKSKKKYILKFYRLAANDFFKTKYKSHTLTHIFNNLNTNINKGPNKFIKNELCLNVFLVRVNFALNFTDSNFLIENGYVFINGVVCYNIYTILNIFDRIQLLNYNEEYIYHRFLISNNITKKARMWFTIQKLYLTRGKQFKTQPNLRKKWPIKIIWQLMDIPRFVEVDFITYTAIILYKPFSHLDIFKFFREDFKPELLRMYNWKYYY